MVSGRSGSGGRSRACDSRGSRRHWQDCFGRRRGFAQVIGGDLVVVCCCWRDLMVFCRCCGGDYRWRRR